MNEETKRLILRGVAGLAWAESRLAEVEESEGPPPDLLRMKHDCASLQVRLDEELRAAEEPEVEWHSAWPVILSGQDLAFLHSLFDLLAHDSKGGGGHLRALLELERFISQVRWV